LSKNQARPETGVRMERASPECGIRAIEGEERRYQLSFSSETPYRRWFGQEVLDHGPDAVNMRQLSDIGVVLFNHNRDRVLGRVENPRIENGRGVCDVVFDADEEAEKIRAKIDGGSIRATSVSYRVENWESVKAGEKSLDGRFAGPCEIAKRWTPVEVSIVAVPADPTVGVGRNDEDENQETRGAEGQMDGKETNLDTTVTAPVSETGRAAGGNGATGVGEAEALARGVEAERARVNEITTMCRGLGMEADAHITSGRSVDEVRAALLDEMIKRQPQVSPRAGDGVRTDEADKFTRAASDALAARSGTLGPERAQEMRKNAGDLGGFRVMRLVQRALEQDGEDTRNMSDEQMLERAFLLGDGSFAAIMDQTAGKVVRDTYEQARTTYQFWTRLGSLSDFKKKPTFRLGEMDELPEVPMTGELTHGKFVEQDPFMRQVRTYGKKVGISRQMLINDDIGQFAKLAAGYANSAARQINRDAYALLTSNPTLEIDGKKLFVADHKNVATAGAPGTATIAQMRKLMRLQKGVDGKTVLNLSPMFLIVPAELEIAARQFMVSVSDPAQNNPGVANVLRGSLEIIVDAELDAVSGKAFYIAAGPMDTDGIGVDFLNGQNQINVRRGEVMGQLGMQWDIYIDYGVYVGDWRGMVYNQGA